MAHYGLYKAKVVEQGDDRQKGRIKVQIPSITGEGNSQWVELCMNVAYDNGGDIAIPKIGDTCYIMFEEGDVTKPVYMGNFFSAFSTPLENYNVNQRVISWDGCRITMEENNLHIENGAGAYIDMKGDDIQIHAGHVGFND